jgi:hypothetical protein
VRLLIIDLGTEYSEAEAGSGAWKPKSKGSKQDLDPEHWKIGIRGTNMGKTDKMGLIWARI